MSSTFTVQNVLPHQVAYTTLGFEQPWTMQNYERVGGWQAWRDIIARLTVQPQRAKALPSVEDLGDLISQST